MSFFAVPTKEFDTNLFHMIGDEWLLICCYDEANNKTNLMTASWGGMGILWNKEVCFLFVRPQRYTHDLLEKQNRFSVCVLPEEYRKAHKVCGSQSGRNVDKVAVTGLHEAEFNGVKAVAESKFVLVVKQLYRDDLIKTGFLEETLLKNYPTDDFHTVYVCEIEKIFQKKDLNCTF